MRPVEKVCAKVNFFGYGINNTAGFIVDEKDVVIFKGFEIIFNDGVKLIVYRGICAAVILDVWIINWVRVF